MDSKKERIEMGKHRKKPIKSVGRKESELVI